MSNVKKNVGYQIAYRVLVILTPLITSPVISRALGADGVGEYSATIAFVTYFTLFAMLGIEKYGNRSVAVVQKDKEKRSRLFFGIYSVQIVSSIIAITAYLVSFLFINRERWLLSAIQGLWLISYLLDINWFFFGIEAFKLTVIRSAVIKVITVVLVVVFIRSPGDLYLYACIMGAGALASQLVLWGSIRKYVYFRRASWADIKPHIKPILKLFIPIIAISVFRLMDKSMLDLLSTTNHIGYYYSADKVVNIPLGLVTAVGTVMLPRIANLLSEDKKSDAQVMIKKSTELTFFLSSAVSFGIAAIAKEFVPLFFGSGYEPVIQLLYWFVPILFLKTSGDIICSQFLIPAHKDNVFIGAMFSGAIANIICNFFLIRSFASVGAVIGTLIAEFVVVIVQLIFTREVPFLRILLVQVPYVLFGGIMLGVVRISAELIDLPNTAEVFLLVVIGGAVYLMLSLFWALVNKHSLFHNTLMRVLSTKHQKGVE